MALTTILGVFLARMIGGYALCLALIGPSVKEGPWPRVSLFVIAGLAVVGVATGLSLWPCLLTAAVAILLERAITFRVRGLGSPVWILPPALWLLASAEWPPGVDTVASAIAVGGTLAAMLLGHGYLTARGLSFTPLKRMALLLFWILVLRAVLVAPAFFGDRIEMMDLVFLSMRAALGLFLPIVLGWMVLQCVKIESNQSATGILYAMTVLVGVFGELIAVYLKLSRGILA